MVERLDILLFGATGFSGMRCIPHLYKLSKCDSRTFTWGIAGRSTSKLEEVLKQVGKDMGVDLKKIPIIVADISDQKSLEAMTSKAKVVINCCGPYRFLGEPVVKACIKTGTHHVDISAEHQFMDKIQLTLDEEAKRKGVYIVTACGFDCLPADLGAVFLQQQFEGTLNSIDSYLEIWQDEGDSTRSIIGYNRRSVMNFSTWESLIHCVAHWEEIAQIHKGLFPESMDKYQPKVTLKYIPHFSDLLGKWAVPLPTADSSSIKRTQKFFYEVEQKRPVQANTYFAVDSFYQLLLLLLFIMIIYPLSKFEFGRKLLLKFPAIVTLGIFRKEPPPNDVVQNTWYQVTFYGEGWKESLGSEDYDYKKSYNKCITGQVKGRDGYYLTGIGSVLSAITVLTETEKLPKNGGVFSAGACFSKTSLIKRLTEYGVDFKIIAQNDL